jgi:hypothetical protein
MNGACSTHGRPKNTSAREVLVGNAKGEHLPDLSRQNNINDLAKAEVDPVHEMKAVAASRVDRFTTKGKSSDVQLERGGEGMDSSGLLCTTGIGSLARGQSDRVLALTPHPYIAPRLKKEY